MENQKNQGNRETKLFITTDYSFAQTPTALIIDRNISRPARLLYGVMHVDCTNKHLNKNPLNFTSRKRLAYVMKCGVWSISKWIGELKKAGWISVHQRAWRSNLVILHHKKKRK